MADPQLNREIVQIAKAIAAARSHKRFRPLVTEIELAETIKDLKAAIAVVDTWDEIAKAGGEVILNGIVALGTSYLKSSGFDILTDTALKGIEPLSEYLRQKASEVLPL